MQKILWDFEIQTNRLILARQINLILIVNKKNELAISWILPTTKWKESKKTGKYLDLLENKKNCGTWG